jgi:hypothetical protein
VMPASDDPHWSQPQWNWPKEPQPSGAVPSANQVITSSGRAVPELG